ncbi:MAG: M23 family metallopeptidase [Actinomycetales bacterium]|nr:M23 family metallopeptidase [Actinomycetales bacterium]
MIRRGASRRSGALAIAALLALVGSVALAPANAAETRAGFDPADYPTWAQVQQAQADEKAASAMVDQLNAQIAALQVQLEETQRVAKEKGEKYAAAQEAYDQAAFTAQQLQDQADAAQAEADQAKRDSARSLAELGRSGNSDLTATLLSQSGSADSLLYRLGAAGRVTERSSDVFARAVQLQKSAQALTDQADAAAAILEDLEAKAQAAFEEAKAAADAVAADLAAQQSAMDEMQAQLAVLTQKRQATEADFQAGQRAAYEAGVVSLDGWAKPAAGCITDNFGMRYHPIYGVWKLHSGVDIGAGYDQPIYAAHSGVVIYAGWFSDLGYYVKIDHGGGMVSGYGHIREGGLRVSTGQWVDAGQVIAKVGSTGGSTGPHLHYMMYSNGNLIDPVPYMADHGVRIGC